MVVVPHTPFSVIDPYTQVLNREWEILEGSALFTSLVKPSNRIKFTDQSGINPIKENIDRKSVV